MPLMVIDHGRIDSPVHSRNRACRQLIIEKGSFTNQRETKAFFDQHLHLRWMRREGILADLHTRVGEPFEQHFVRLGVTLWVIEHCQILLQVYGV